MNFSSYLNRYTVIEFFAVVFSILYTVLITYGNSLCWPAALIGSLLFMYLVYQKKLYAETVLHTFYFIMGIYGWFTWGVASEFKVISWGVQTNAALVLLGFLAVFISGFLLTKHTSAQLPYIDSFTTIFSFIGTFMMIHMVLENWIYWIVIDSVSIFMYARRGLYIATLLFFIYTILAVNGYLNWMNG